MVDVTSRQRSPRAEKIMEVARHLVIEQGFKAVTMAEIADRAHVGKGTAYQYWRTKEELFLELIGRELATVLIDLADAVITNPRLATPDALCATVVRYWLQRPLILALQTANGRVLGGLVDDRSVRELLTQHGAGPILRDLMPVWRRFQLIADDWSSTQQSDAMSLLIVGYFTLTAGDEASADLLNHTLELAIRKMIDLQRTNQAQRKDLAQDVSKILRSHATLITASVAAAKGG